jgi:ribosomal protein S18 acetylase RimI-like enzyme
LQCLPSCNDELVIVRQARSGDERDLAEVRVRGWQRGYAGILDGAFLAAMSIDDNEQRWATILEQQTGLRHTLVADIGASGSKVVGYSSFGPYRITMGYDKTLEIGELVLPGTVGEVYGFYVHPDHWGSQVANELMLATISALSDDGWPLARLWVLRDNPRARH